MAKLDYKKKRLAPPDAETLEIDLIAVHKSLFGLFDMDFNDIKKRRSYPQ